MYLSPTGQDGDPTPGGELVAAAWSVPCMAPWGACGKSTLVGEAFDFFEGKQVFALALRSCYRVVGGARKKGGRRVSVQDHGQAAPAAPCVW